MYIWQSVLNTQFMHYTKQIQRHKLTSLLSFSVVNKTVHNKGGSARLCVETGAEVERNVDHNLSRTSARVPGPSGCRPSRAAPLQPKGLRRKREEL